MKVFSAGIGQGSTFSIELNLFATEDELGNAPLVTSTRSAAGDGPPRPISVFSENEQIPSTHGASTHGLIHPLSSHGVLKDIEAHHEDATTMMSLGFSSHPPPQSARDKPPASPIRAMGDFSNRKGNATPDTTKRYNAPTPRMTPRITPRITPRLMVSSLLHARSNNRVGTSIVLEEKKNDDPDDKDGMANDDTVRSFHEMPSDEYSSHLKINVAKVPPDADRRVPTADTSSSYTSPRLLRLPSSPRLLHLPSSPPSNTKYNGVQNPMNDDSSYHASKLRVLVVDDSAVNRKVAVRLFQAKGFVCIEEANNGEQAVEKVRSCERFDLILMDYHMPLMNGAEASRAIKSMGYDGVITAVTGNIVSSIEKELVDSGADNVLPKPMKSSHIDQILSGT